MRRGRRPTRRWPWNIPWTRRTRYLSRAPLPYVVDVDAEAVGRLRQHARRAVLRNAVAIGTLLISFVVKLDLWQTAIAMVTVKRPGFGRGSIY